jgi:PAS domain S-box-containing protein
MSSTASEAKAIKWSEKNGAKDLDLLFRAIVLNLCVPVLLADDDSRVREASVGATLLLGRSRDQIVGRLLEEFAEPGFRPQLSKLWRQFRDQGEQSGTLELLSPAGKPLELGYEAKSEVLPARNLLVLHNKDSSPETAPCCARDYGFYLASSEGFIVAWYSGASRIYGYEASEAIGRQVSFLCSMPQDVLKRAATKGHLGAECWHTRKDGSQFWANTVTLALRDASGDLDGFASVVRDFSKRHELDEKLKRNRARLIMSHAEPKITGTVSGEFERIPEANDVFLDLVGYTREDLETGVMNWPSLTPPEYAAADGHAHEEALQFGACTPFEKELIRKDGTRVPVLVATAVLKLCPFRWISFVQDLRDRDQFERVEQVESDVVHTFDEMVGNSAALKLILRQIEVVAPTDSTVMILGETGTGKELVARAIHRMSPRHGLPWVTLNCAAIPTGLLESELFGYERGAFTGALNQKIGRFEMANRGTLFLDEVGDIPLDLQPKLLRALQEKSFERLGGTRTIPIDVRLVAATNRDLLQMMKEKMFRSDLYYRLNVFPITTPPLRERPEDIPILARYFTKKYSTKMNRQIEKIPSETMKALINWSWPGNVRELENFIERAVILSRGPNLRAPLSEIRLDSEESAGSGTLEQVERDHILRVFRECGGVVTTAATRLGLHRTTLNAMMRKLGITRSDL